MSMNGAVALGLGAAMFMNIGGNDGSLEKADAVGSGSLLCTCMDGHADEQQHRGLPAEP